MAQTLHSGEGRGVSFESQQIGEATLYCGDCLEILPTLDKVDAVVTDPPYGIGEANKNHASRGKLAVAKDYGRSEWDNKTNEAAIALAVAAAKQSVVFGGNYYDLPPTPCWLVWDKENGANDFADCELAWTNMKGAVRLKRYMWNGMLRANKERRGDHPTQKPVGVMEWAIGFTEGETVLDPFMGSGTTGVACANLGRKFIGIEIETKYFDIACERIEAAYSQGRLFA